MLAQAHPFFRTNRGLSSVIIFIHTSRFRGYIRDKNFAEYTIYDNICIMSTELSTEKANPFHPNKLALHDQKIAALAVGIMIVPQTIEVDLTDGFCNQGCLHCCFGSNQRRAIQRIDKDVLLAALTESYQLGTRAVELVGGGEPTTHPDIQSIIDEIIHIGDGDMQVGVITNGVLAERLLPVADKLTFVRISLDTADSATYASMHGAPHMHFAKVLRNIQKLREAISAPSEDRRLGVGYLVVPPYNHHTHQILEGGRLADRLGADYIAFRPAELEASPSITQWKEAQIAIGALRQELASRNSCTAVFGGSGNRWETLQPNAHPTGTCHAKPLVAVIQANGDIAFCILYRNRREMKIGNIYEGSFVQQWFSQQHIDAWRGSAVDTCPNPCKFYRYNEITQSAAAGTKVDPPAPNEVAHHDFV